MPERIALLPDVVINQIAAGEVIERPASVVKELVENSIDADARQVTVEMELGGTRLIRVHDDGCGIARDELALALRRHATSKLRSIDDLVRLQSLGFRGEALPSIGSVSRLTLTSNTGGDANAWTVSMTGAERVSEPQPAARAVGTTVEVRELFHCVPARRRFLKSERTEFLHAQDWLRRTALARPNVDLTLTHNGQRVLAVRAARTAADLPARIERIVGAAFMRHARRVDAGHDGLSLHGWIATADGARNQNDLQYWLVNGRPVRDARLLHAVRLAFGDTLPAGRHAAFVLYLDIDPSALDVNVHPAKTEVRFADARRVHDFVFSAARRALDDAGGTVAVSVRAAETSEGYAPPPERTSPTSQTASDVARSRWRGEWLAAVDAQRALLRCDAQPWLLDVARAVVALWSDDIGIDARPLMFPVVITPGAEAIERLHRLQPTLRTQGIEIDVDEDAIVRVRAVPSWLGREVQRMVDAILSVPYPPSDAFATDLRASMARIAAAAITADRTLAEALVALLSRHHDLDALARRRIARRLDADILHRLVDGNE